MGVQFLDALTANLNFAFALAGGGEVVGKLHSEPCFRRAAKCLGEPDRHLRANA